ncbi:MAG TPA: RDD family protein [Pseudonocardiaceae bacterium]|nr:RDD family protein [Pseudonocardiaceae bacterium]
MTHPQQGGGPRQAYPGPQPTLAQLRDAPIVHGSDGDPRYPSPRKLRRALAFILDMVLHFGIAVGVFFGTKHIPALDNLIGLWALIGWIGSSLIDRVLIQWAFGTTVGKAIFGLRLVGKDGGRPKLGQLMITWLVGLWYGVELAGALAGASGGLDVDDSKHFLPAVRMKDVRALRNA